MSDFDKMDELVNTQQRVEREINALRAACPHVGKKSGNPKYQQIPGTSLVKCSKCGEVFTQKPIKPEESAQAVEVLSNMINQLKLLSSGEIDDKLVKKLGAVLSSIKEVQKIYNNRVLNNGKKKNKNKKNNKNRYDGYSYNINDVF